MPTALGEHGLELGPSMPLFSRGLDLRLDENLERDLELFNRGEFSGDINSLILQAQRALNNNIERAITSGTSSLPIRENLEAEAKLLIPLDTPLRNKLRRTPGAGTASLWRQMTSVGGGYGLSTTVTSGASSATQTVGSTVGMQAGMSLYFATTNAFRIVSSVTNATTVVLTATISTTTSEVVTLGPNFQPGGDAAAIRSFFAETGAPADHVTTYASKSAGYKLMGTYFSVTGFAMAAGANFQNQLAMEKLNAIRALMLNEENALINGDSAATGAPWGDGSTAYAFDGLLKLITTSNGTPTQQVQTAVGALTTAHIDAQVTRLWAQGAQGLWILCNGQEANSLNHLAEASGSILRVVQGETGMRLGKRVVAYIHPITGEEIPIMVSRFVPAGTMIFGSDNLPDGSPTMDVNVLPQVQLPELAPNTNIQGYVAQELAPTTSAPQVYPGIVTVYEVLRLKSALHVAVSKGLTPV